MESVRIKAYAKINLTLYITGTAGGYHNLDSIVSSVNLFDEITLKKRKDKRVFVTMCGMGSEAILEDSNNAVKAAKLFIEKFSTDGVDITVNKNIPMGAGLGGSSADAAGVLNGLAKLYGIKDKESLKLIADKTGSDTRYMLSGGYARLFGRGDTVKDIDGKLKLNILLLVPDENVSTAQCYSEFDKCGVTGGSSDFAERAIINADIRGLADGLSNALMPAAVSLSGEIEKCVNALNEFSPLAVNMTGSGSGVYALFENKKLCAEAKSRYHGSARAYMLEVK
ncbi:MAG: 4-(cytidine 5'-diphospho)-2-C-methyl-D-erythritol kinase [Clostridia bacterium]|nr:4-(cytidine 5'-diphospho)-2-C-methyl-D-erythritol kinase [Clostridia bacterium]